MDKKKASINAYIFTIILDFHFPLSSIIDMKDFSFNHALGDGYFSLHHLQGMNDDIVDWSHGKRLWELAKEKYDPLWVKGGGHCNLETYPEYIKHLRKFVNAMEKHSLAKQMKKQLTTNTSIKVKHNKCLRFGKR